MDTNSDSLRSALESMGVSREATEAIVASKVSGDAAELVAKLREGSVPEPQGGETVMVVYGLTGYGAKPTACVSSKSQDSADAARDLLEALGAVASSYDISGISGYGVHTVRMDDLVESAYENTDVAEEAHTSYVEDGYGYDHFGQDAEDVIEKIGYMTAVDRMLRDSLDSDTSLRQSVLMGDPAEHIGRMLGSWYNSDAYDATNMGSDPYKGAEDLCKGLSRALSPVRLSEGAPKGSSRANELRAAMCKGGKPGGSGKPGKDSPAD